MFKNMCFSGYQCTLRLDSAVAINLIYSGLVIPLFGAPLLHGLRLLNPAPSGSAENSFMESTTLNTPCPPPVSKPVYKNLFTPQYYFF